jgi:transposase InsO family protein
MKEKMRFVSARDSGLYRMSELCERFGISRKTGYKWLKRFEVEGVDGLKERSRKPHSSPNRTSEEIQELLIEVRRSHPSWGPEKLLDVVGSRHGELELPARSTVAAILKREGLVKDRRRRRHHRHPGRPQREVTAPNQVWTADFKGQFKTRDGRWCYPLTVADEHSRYLLACDALRSTEVRGVRRAFERLFREHGLPEAIRTDNGVPFVKPTAIHGLSSLSVWWVELGIEPERIQPGKPQQNGRHERMHRTLKQEAVIPPANTLHAQQKKFDGFREEFNHERPHQALGNKRPAQIWSPSPRPLPRRVPKPNYPGHYQVRLVVSTGHIKFKNRLLFLSQTLNKRHVGLEEVDDGVWSIYFYDILLARLDERTFELMA